LEEGVDVYSAAEVDGAASGQFGAQLGAWPAHEVDASPPNVSRLALGSAADRSAREAAEKGAQSLLSSDYYVRQYGAHGMRNLSADVDEYGLDPHVEEQARPWLETLCTRYFRLSLEGAERIPATGRALLVANRAGSLPWDGLMLRTALRMRRPELSPLRWLAEDTVIHSPFLGTFMNRVGAVRACPENAERLLTQDRLVAAFPEGAQGSQKLFRDRYRLQRFGRGGYVKLALKLGAPILPTAIIGAEEVNPLLARFSLFGRREGADFLPITPTFPWLGPLGLLPAPVKWRVIVGEPVDLSGYGPEAADDALVVHRLNEQIRGILQSLVDQAQSSRRSVLFG
jgi:1-acyl-sn-glycerol-3-phosphate acyltransferase